MRRYKIVVWVVGAVVAVTLRVAEGQRRPAVPAARLVYSIPGYCAAPQWQPGGDRVACVGSDAAGAVLEIRGPTGAAAGVIRGLQSSWAWSPDGGRIAASVATAGSQYHLTVFDADGSNPRQLTSTPESSISAISWSRDATQIYYTRRDQRAREERVVVAATGGTARPSPYSRPAYSPDGRTIAYRRTSGGRVEIVLRDVASDADRVAGEFDGFAATWGPVWSPDGRSVAVAGTLDGGASGHVSVLDVANVAAGFRRFDGVTGDAFAWSPDGTEVATSQFDGPPPRGRGTRRMNLVAINVSNDQRRVLLRPDRGACRAYQPSWSATGLAFVHQCDAPLPTETRVTRLR